MGTYNRLHDYTDDSNRESYVPPPVPRTEILPVGDSNNSKFYK